MALSRQASHHSLVQKMHKKMQSLGVLVTGLANKITTSVRHITQRQLAIGAIATIALVGVLYTAGFFWPRTVGFSYAGTNCFFNPMFLPATSNTQPSAHFTATNPTSFGVAGYPLLSVQTCITPIQPPQNSGSETVRITPFNNPWLKKTITVNPGSAPAVQPALAKGEPAAPDTPLLFNLSQPDAYFEYRLTINGKQQDCTKDEQKISCNLGGLALLQSTEYPMALQRIFNGTTAGNVVEQTITTIEPVTIANTSIGPGEKVFGIPADIAIAFTKPIDTFDNLNLKRTGSEPQDIPITPSVHKDHLVISFNEPLPRSASYELSLANVRAQDGSRLPGPYTHTFETSGGPQVQSVSIGGARVQPDTPLTITFDAPLATDQELQNFIRLESGGNRINATLAISDKTVTIQPRGLNRCTVFNIQIIDGLRNFAGVTGNSAWAFTSRTVCQTTFSIGSSVQGRGIIGYRFGNGPSKIIIVGTLHGNEKSATNTLNSFINQLEANFDRIPANRAIIVIPNANPDGFAANTRTNARNVDLNRNFAANGWKSDVTMPGGALLPGGGGSSPMSEPESRALANFIASQGARLVLSYHSVAGLVAANEAGDSLAIAKLYGQKSNFPAYGNEADSAFAYDTTGAFEDWLRDAYGIPGLLIELSTQSSNEINRHQDALWTMVTLP